MKILILGGAGFLGTWTTLRLLAEKCNTVMVFDRKNADYSRFPKNYPNLIIKTGDFVKQKNMENLVDGVDTVYHLISSTTPGTSDNSLEKEFIENIIPTIRLLDACIKKRIKKVIFFSSGGTVYGKQSDCAPIKETNPTNPISFYGFQKLMIEKAILMYGTKYELDYRIIRLANPFGIYQNPFGGQGVVSTFAYRVVKGLPITIFGDGNNIRDFIHISDAIEMTMNIVNKTTRSKIFNVGSGIGYSINSILTFIEEYSGKKAIVEYKQTRNEDVPVNILDISLYQSEVSSAPPEDIRKGIKNLVEYYQRNS